jgi:hypothetical protein
MQLSIAKRSSLPSPSSNGPPPGALRIPAFCIDVPSCPMRLVVWKQHAVRFLKPFPNTHLIVAILVACSLLLPAS